jgi:pentatricopeptide repeat protein
VTCYNAVVSACARCSQPERAFLVVEDMLAAGITPSVRTSSALLNACASAGLTARAEGVVADMRQRGYMIDEYVHAALIDCYARAGGSSYSSGGGAGGAALARCKEIAAEAAEAESAGGRLPRVVFNALLGAHVALRDYAGALSFFGTAQRSHGVTPSTTTYRHVVGAHLRAGGVVPAPPHGTSAAAAASAAASAAPGASSGGSGVSPYASYAAALPVPRRNAHPSVALSALTSALAAADDAAAAGVACNVDTRRELIHFSIAMLGGPHSTFAAAAAHRILRELVAASGFINTPDGSAWLARTCRAELGEEGLSLAHAVWDAMARHSRTPSASATNVYLAALRARAPHEEARIAAARATLPAGRKAPGAGRWEGSGRKRGGSGGEGAEEVAGAEAGVPLSEDDQAAAHAAAAAQGDSLR